MIESPDELRIAFIDEITEAFKQQLLAEEQLPFLFAVGMPLYVGFALTVGLVDRSQQSISLYYRVSRPAVPRR